MKTKSGVVVNGYPLVVKYEQSPIKIVEVYIGNTGGYNIRKILADCFTKKIIDKIMESE